MEIAVARKHQTRGSQSLEAPLSLCTGRNRTRDLRFRKNRVPRS